MTFVDRKIMHVSSLDAPAGPAPAGRRPDPAELAGAWRRTLLTRPDGRRDTTTTALWVQGPRLFAHLRQPARRPAFSGRGRPLSARQTAWLGRQEGFAGELAAEDGMFTWRRRLDLGPRAPYGDRGRPVVPDDAPAGLVVVDGPYAEHWQRLPGSGGVSAALRFTGPRGIEGLLVRAGSFFAHAHGTPGVHGCEISVGRVVDGQWVIIWSSRPHHEGELLAPRVTGDVLRLRGAPQEFAITAREGSTGAFPAP
jgi:hypothetical protein